MAAPQKWTTYDELLLAIAEALVRERRPIDIHTRGYDGGTALHVAAVWNDAAAIDLLLDHGAKIDALGDMGCTPLHDAVIQGHFEAAERLVQRGAALSILNQFGQTPLGHAEMRGDQRLIDLLTAAKAARAAVDAR